ncbi:hypothetical protein [Agromyces aureus]|uniref:DUF7882 domain-containing protein n=1 Tax=Agromyces aureus TaxID=453304 RepID=A0A191WFP6_9MICO|nr:hypothetical protein [Agromyces aureus]ANJ27110.1 hypothetical protein ATC03_10600 [Agromyces aureus]
MGLFIYDTRLEVDLDDRVLAHLQIVIVDKFRRNEKFAMSLLHAGRSVTIWMTAQSRVQFVYSGNRHPAINPAWLGTMSERAGMSGVLRIVPEPPAPPAPARAHPAGRVRSREPALR